MRPVGPVGPALKAAQSRAASKSQTEGCQDVGLVSENGVNWVEPIWTPYGPNGDSKLNDFNDLAT